MEQQHRSIIMSWRVKNTSRIFLTAGLIFELELVQCSLWRLLKGAARKKKKRRSDTALSKTFFLLCLSLRNSAVHLSVYLRLINYILILILAPTEDYKLTSSLCEKINLSIWQKKQPKKGSVMSVWFHFNGDGKEVQTSVFGACLECITVFICTLEGFWTQLFLNGVAPDSVTHRHYYCQCRGQFCTLKESPSSHMLESITVQNTTFPTQASKIQDGQNELLYHPKLTTSTAQSLYI